MSVLSRQNKAIRHVCGACACLSPLQYCPLQHSFPLQGWRRRKDANSRQTLQQRTLFTHKANPMFDTTQTLTTTSSSARGDDFEVIRVPPGQPPIQETPHPETTGYMPPLYTVSYSYPQSRTILMPARPPNAPKKWSK